MGSLCPILVALSVVAALFGASQPGTVGVSLIAIGCLLSILARLAQSSQQHQEMMAALGKPVTKEAAPEGQQALY